MLLLRRGLKEEPDVVIRRVGYILAVFLVVVGIISYAISLDAGLALAMGMAIRDGHLPYRDFFENRTPALHYLVAATLAITYSLWPSRLLLLAVSLANAWLAARLAEHLASRQAAAWAALFSLIAVLLFQGYSLLTEPFIAFLLLLAAWLAWVKRQPPLAAVAATATVWFKQPALLPAAVFLGILFWNAHCWRDRGLILGGATLAIALPLAALWHAGVGPAMVDQTIGANLRSASGRWLGVAEFTKTALGIIGATGILWVLGGVGLCEGSGLVDRRKNLALGATAFAALVTVVPSLYLHYFLIAAALGSVAAGIGMACLLASLALPRHKIALVALALLPLVAQGAVPSLSVLKQGYLFRQIALARAVEQATQPGEPILVLTYSPGYYFLAHRYPPVPTFFTLWINDSPQLEEQMVESLGRDVHIAVIVAQPDQENCAKRVRDTIRQRGTLLLADPGLKAEVWRVN